MVSNVLVGVLVAVLAFFYHMSVKLDFHKVVYNHKPGVCRQVEGPVHGSEDIELIRSEGIAFVTSGVIWLKPSPVQGKMFLYDFNQKSSRGKLVAKELKITGSHFDRTNFHPHGLTHWVVDGIIRLYVVSHTAKIEHSIEVFEFDPKETSLVHKKTIRHEALIRPNDIVAVGPDQFIFTNDGVTQSYHMNELEVVSGYRGGTVYYYDGQEFHQLLEGKASPNGITYDATTHKLFVSMISDETIDVYDLSNDYLTASLVSRINVYTGCDNLFLDSDGSLYSGCHPITYMAAEFLKNCTNFDVKAPSQVLHLRFDKDYKNAAITEVYSDDGREITGSSIATLYTNQILIGSVCRNLIHCEVADASVL